MVQKKGWIGLLFCLVVGIELIAQSFSLDSSFQPFFNIRNSPNSGAITKIWEDRANGKTYIVGSFRFKFGQLDNNGLTIMNQNGSSNVSISVGAAAGIINIFPINDSTLFLGDNGNFFQTDLSGADVAFAWRTNYLKTVKCAQGQQPFFFKNGSSLMANGMGRPGSCKIINPPDTFPHRYIVKADSLGLWDSTFTQDANYDPRGFIGYDSNRIIIYGRTYLFTQYDGKKVDGLCRIYHDGTLDTTFSSPLLNISSAGDYVALPPEPDGKFFIVGKFKLKGDSINYHSMVRLNPNGTLDTSFRNYQSPIDSNGILGAVVTVARTPDKGYLIGGFFNKYQGHPVNCIAKIDSSGKLETQYFNNRGPDSSYISGNGLQSVSHILPSAYGGYYVVGDFLKWDNQPSQPIVRLNDLVVGVEEQESSKSALKVEVFPNPAQEQVNIRLAEAAAIQQIRVFDLTGRKQNVEAEKRNNYEYILNLSNLEKGVYFLMLELQRGNTVTKKIIKQ